MTNVHERKLRQATFGEHFDASVYRFYELNHALLTITNIG
jgi:hypothetical protein